MTVGTGLEGQMYLKHEQSTINEQMQVTQLDKKLKPDAYLFNFYPISRGSADYDSNTLRYMKMNAVYDRSRQSNFERRVKDWIKHYIVENFPRENVMIAVAPGHLAYDTSSFLYRLVPELVNENKQDLNLEDGSDLLIRHKGLEIYAPKQVTVGGIHSEKTHHNSIRTNKLNVKGKCVIIVDDVWTTGCFLRVCEEKVRSIGPKDVRLLTIGKTILD